MTNDTSHFITASGLVKIYKIDEIEVFALQGLDLEIARGEMIAIVGPSGCGKTTFLSALGGLDRPSAGQLQVDGKDLLKLSQAELTRYRREEVGFVWQQTTRNLLPYLTARENIELLMTLAGRSAGDRRAWSTELLAAVGMGAYAGQRLTELSGGQQQRVAIACALANRPKILLADEPTGEVDGATADLILTLLQDIRSQYRTTIVIVTHDSRVAERTDRVIQMRDGRFSAERVLRDGEANPAIDGAPTNGSGARPTALAAEEFVVVDRAGRLQLPQEQRALAGIGRRARVEIVDGGILIRPNSDDDELPTPTADESVGSYQSLYSAEPPPDKPRRKRRR